MWLVALAWAVCAVLEIGCGGAHAGDADAAADAAVSPFEAWGLAWSEPDPTRRMALLEIAIADQVRYVSLGLPQGELTDRAAISDVIGSFLGGGGSTGATSGVDQYDDRARYSWYFTTPGTMVTGRDVDALAADGRIARIVEFWGDPPATGTPSAVQQAFLDAWNASDPAQRAPLLDAAVTDDVLLLLPPSTRTTTRSELSSIIDGLFAATPGRTTRYRAGFLVDKEFWYVEFETRDAGGNLVADGVISAELAPDGRIHEIVFFRGPLPPVT